MWCILSFSIEWNHIKGTCAGVKWNSLTLHQNKDLIKLSFNTSLFLAYRPLEQHDWIRIIATKPGPFWMNSAKTSGNVFVAQNQGSSVQLQSMAEFRSCNNQNSPLARPGKGQSKSKLLTLCKAYSNKLTASSYTHPIGLFHGQSRQKEKCNKLANIPDTWSHSQVEQLYCDVCPSWTGHIPWTEAQHMAPMQTWTS